MRRALPEVLLRALASLGLVGGFLWGFHHEPHVVCTHAGSPANTLNRCTSHSIMEIGVHWIVALGGGLLLGGAIGLVLALALRSRLA